jgi:signal transduction histidine kinase/ActR/RegA family two-component response regulator
MKKMIFTVLPFILWTMIVAILLAWNFQTIENNMEQIVKNIQDKISIKISEQSYTTTNKSTKTVSGTTHLIVWMFGIGVLYFFRRYRNKQIQLMERISYTIQQKNMALEAANREKSELLSQFLQKSEILAKQNEEFERLSQTRAVTNHLLNDALESQSLKAHLKESLLLITAIPWYTIQSRGAIFLWDKKIEKLVLAVQYELPEQVLDLCAKVPMGHCLCGRAAQTKQMVSSDSMDEHQVAKCNVITDHGHYCLPIKMDNQLIGVLNLFVEKGHIQTADEKNFLRVITSTLAGIIVRCQQEEQLKKVKTIAEQATKAKSAFLANMSHEIRSPMNAILGMSEVLGESNLDHSQKRYVQIINNAGEGLLALINDILDLSKIEAGQLKLEAIQFDPCEIAESSVAIFKAKALDQGIVITSSFDKSMPNLVVGDPQRLSQILLNLLSNAVKFTERGKITLVVAKISGKMLHFSVSDTGIGISSEQQKKIFKPYIQADKSTTHRFGGTGLGLSICQNLVEKMNGKIWVESKLNQGSTFHLEIPLQEVQDDEIPKLSNDSQLSSKPDNVRSKLSILLADDVDVNCMVVEAFLNDSPYRLTTVEDGFQAFEQFKTGVFDIVLMDINMPGMDGYEATKKIREWEKEKQLLPTPVLALTANAMKDDIEKSRGAGCNHHLSKPIRKKSLLEAIDSFTSS